MPRPSPQTERVVTLLSALASAPEEPWTLASLTRRLDANKSTVHSMLAVLHGAGWLVRDPTSKAYRLGPALGRIGQVAADGFPALSFARSAIDELAARFGAGGAVLIASDRSLVVGHTVATRHDAPGPQVGAAIPLRAPFGAALVAWADDDIVEDWMRHGPEVTRDDYLHSLEAVRLRGWAIELAPDVVVDQLLAELRRRAGRDSASVTLTLLEQVADRVVGDADQLADEIIPDEHYSVNAVNAPVFDSAGEVSLVISLLGFDDPCSGRTVTEIGRALRAASADITAAVGNEA